MQTHTDQSIYEALCEDELISGFGLKVKQAITDFTTMIQEIRAEEDNLTISDIYDNVLNRSGYLKALEDAGTVEADGRIENIMEFKSVISEFEKGLADGSVAVMQEEMQAERLALMGEGLEAEASTPLSSIPRADNTDERHRQS